MGGVTMLVLAANLIDGFGAVLTPQNLLLAAAGVTLGTLVGVLPGIGPALTIALLLPLTFNFSDPVGAFILFAGIYAGGMYGGSATSILLKTPGVSASASGRATRANSSWCGAAPSRARALVMADLSAKATSAPRSRNQRTPSSRQRRTSP